VLVDINEKGIDAIVAEANLLDHRSMQRPSLQPPKRTSYRGPNPLMRQSGSGYRMSFNIQTSPEISPVTSPRASLTLPSFTNDLPSAGIDGIEDDVEEDLSFYREPSDDSIRVDDFLGSIESDVVDIEEVVEVGMAYESPEHGKPLTIHPPVPVPVVISTESTFSTFSPFTRRPSGTFIPDDTPSPVPLSSPTIACPAPLFETHD
jgi:hypothetical protein